ncbi:hypothetical protein E2C01_040142 [Portunus trituberculatus]|uniref:Uncharacterized protein n=1 Tax=Portunus trituberculatus TaxID=210409 RepID=A0A5B7FGK8_PORTR|nr:hypothetical protein [Portunus trituberculatus]
MTREAKKCVSVCLLLVQGYRCQELQQNSSKKRRRSESCEWLARGTCSSQSILNLNCSLEGGAQLEWGKVPGKTLQYFNFLTERVSELAKWSIQRRPRFLFINYF